MSLQTIYLPFDVPLLPAKMLSAGSLKCIYENGNLRYISLNEREVVRMIYSAVRNENWQTAAYVITDEVIEENEAGFAIKYTAHYQLNEIHYKAFFEITGRENTVTFSMKGVALNDFRTNRIGICVLHPIEECMGKKVLITQPDGGIYEAHFPELISPHQPFKRVQQMSWTDGAGAQLQLTFAGDVFETEDQRNWTDASFKTYSRPLELPFPYSVHEGETIDQRVILKVLEDESVSRQSGLKVFDTAEIKVPFPDIGYSRRKGFRHLSDLEITLLRKVPFDHYRVELHLNENEWRNELSSAFSEAKKLNTKLEFVVFFGSEIENNLKELTDKVQHEQQYIKSILVLQQKGNITPHEIFQNIYRALKNDLPDVKTGYGTDGFFAELNRNPPQMTEYDFVSFSINPQVHAVDTRSLMENLGAQGDAIKTAQTFAADKAVQVSPVTFKTRSNDGKDVDERLHTSFAAWWTLQTIKNLSGANSITFYETVGAKGLIKEVDSSAKTQCEQNVCAPVFNVLAVINDFRPVYIIKQDGNKESFMIENSSGDRLEFIVS